MVKEASALLHRQEGRGRGGGDRWNKLRPLGKGLGYNIFCGSIYKGFMKI